MVFSQVLKLYMRLLSLRNRIEFCHLACVQDVGAIDISQSSASRAHNFWNRPNIITKLTHIGLRSFHPFFENGNYQTFWWQGSPIEFLDWVKPI
jgi:hypothetical protein